MFSGSCVEPAAGSAAEHKLDWSDLCVNVSERFRFLLDSPNTSVSSRPADMVQLLLQRHRERQDQTHTSPKHIRSFSLICRKYVFSCFLINICRFDVMLRPDEVNIDVTSLFSMYNPIYLYWFSLLTQRKIKRNFLSLIIIIIIISIIIY